MKPHALTLAFCLGLILSNSSTHAATTINPGQTQTLNGASSLGSETYVISGGVTTLQDEGSPSGLLLRGAGGLIELLDFASAGTASIRVEGGPGNGGRPGQLFFRGNATAANARMTNRPGALGPNFKNESPNPMDGFSGETRFFDNATAGTAQFTNEPEEHDGRGNGGAGGYTAFAGKSTADHASFLTLGAVINNARGGRVDFTEQSTAGFGVFRNSSSSSSYPYSQGRTVFFDVSNAGHGVFTNVGANGGFLASGGTTEFRGSASAGNGTFVNEGPTGGSFPQSGITQFFDTSTAGAGTFINKPGASTGGRVEFYGRSSAAGGSFSNDSNGINTPLNGGETTFKEDSVAGHANFHTMGSAGGYVTFHDRTSADQASFVIDPNLNNARIVFDGSASAGNASFEIGGGGYLQFFDSSTAGNARILLRGNGAQSLAAIGGGTAGEAFIIVMGAEVTGAVGGSLSFAAPGSAGDAIITINGASVASFGAAGGVARFDYSSDAGHSTLVVNGGSNGGPGGRLEFGRGASAAHAQITVHAGGTLDVSGNVDFSTAVGSIEGEGGIALGSSLIRVGLNNASTTFSGVIYDASNPKGGYFANGQLTKEGTGTLNLSGTNTYSGLTTINAGALAVNGALAGGVQVNAGATLKGTGQISGPVTVAPGGIVSPGNSPGTLTILGDYSQQPGSILEIEVAGPEPQNRDSLIVHGNVDLSGTVLLIFSGYAPAANETLSVLQVAGTLTAHNFNVVSLGVKPGFQASYQVSGGKLVLTAASAAQLRTPADPLEGLTPAFGPQSGFLFPVFTVTGATYRFETSTDLKTWTRLSEAAGANNLAEFRHLPNAGDAHRFYRVLQGAP